MTRPAVWLPPQRQIYKEKEWEEKKKRKKKKRESESCECGMAVNHAKATHSLNLSIHLPPSPASSLSLSVLSLLLSTSLLSAHLSFSPTRLSLPRPLLISHLKPAAERCGMCPPHTNRDKAFLHLRCLPTPRHSSPVMWAFRTFGVFSHDSLPVCVLRDYILKMCSTL